MAPRHPLAAPVIALTGAGISTASGIPDFRSPGGVWDQFDPLEFTIQRFRADPAHFWDRRARLIAAMDYLGAGPNAAHRALSDAVRSDQVRWVVTQNVDGLHGRAGTPPDRLLELHGNGTRVVCVACGRREATSGVLERRVDGVAPICLHCDGLLKPDVVLFGEPVLLMPRAAACVQDAATLLVVGTSLGVHPAAGLVDLALDRGARLVIVNREPTPYDDAADRLLRGPIETELPRLLAPPDKPLVQ